MKRNPDLYRASVQVTLFRGPNRVRSLAFRLPPIPQDGLVDVWLEEFAVKLKATVQAWAKETVDAEA